MPQEQDQDGRDEGDGFDLEALDGGEEGGELEAGQDDDLLATVGAQMGDGDEAVDVAEGEDADSRLGRGVALEGAGVLVEGHFLNDVGDYIVVRDHDGFLRVEWLDSQDQLTNADIRAGKSTHRQARCSAGVAEVGYLARALAGHPLEGGQLRQRLALLYQVINRLEGCLVVRAGHGEEEDALVGDPRRLGRLEGILQQGHAGEEDLGARGLELVLQLDGGVGGAGRCDDAIESVDGVGEGDVVNLYFYHQTKLSTRGEKKRRRGPAHRVHRVEADDLVPLCPLARVEVELLAQRAGEMVLAHDDLCGRVRLARDTAGVGVPRLSNGGSAVFLIRHEFPDGDRVGRICFCVSVTRTKRKQRGREGLPTDEQLGNPFWGCEDHGGCF